MCGNYRELGLPPYPTSQKLLRRVRMHIFASFASWPNMLQLTREYWLGEGANVRGKLIVLGSPSCYLKTLMQSKPEAWETQGWPQTLTTTSLVIVWPVELPVIGNWNIFHLLVVYVFFGNGPKVSLYFSEFYILRTRKWCHEWIW